MTACYELVAAWVNRAKREGAAYLIVANDSFDHDNYPVQVPPGGDVHAEIDRIRGMSMQRVDEVYDLNADLAPQLAASRAWSVPPRPEGADR